MKTLQVAVFTLPQLRHACYSAAMVRAVWEGTRVLNDDSSFVNFVGQNFLGIRAPVSMSASNSLDLKQRCNFYFRQDYLPTIHRVSLLSPQVVLAWMRDIELDKQLRLVDIRARFARVQAANEAIRRNLLVSQRAMIVVERTASIFVAAVPAYLLLTGAAAVAVGSASMIALGFAGAHMFARPLGGITASAICFQSLLQGGIHVAEDAALEGGHDWALQQSIAQEIKAALRAGGERLAKDPRFQEFMAEHINKKIEALSAKVIGQTGVVVCVGIEAFAQIKEGQEDWNAGEREAR